MNPNGLSMEGGWELTITDRVGFLTKILDPDNYSVKCDRISLNNKHRSSPMDTNDGASVITSHKKATIAYFDGTKINYLEGDIKGENFYSRSGDILSTKESLLNMEPYPTHTFNLREPTQTRLEFDKGFSYSVNSELVSSNTIKIKLRNNITVTNSSGIDLNKISRLRIWHQETEMSIPLGEKISKEFSLNKIETGTSVKITGELITLDIVESFINVDAWNGTCDLIQRVKTNEPILASKVEVVDSSYIPIGYFDIPNILTSAEINRGDYKNLLVSVSEEDSKKTVRIENVNKDKPIDVKVVGSREGIYNLKPGESKKIFLSLPKR